MAIPNPNPNIADGIKCDNKTYSSNKIESLITMATELPIPAAGDAGKVLTVNAGADAYELDTPVAPESIIDDEASSTSTVYSSDKVDDLVSTINTAISGKQDALTLTTSNATAEEGTTFDDNYIRKYGKSVQINITLKVASVTRWATIATIPEDYRPKNTLTILGCNAQTSTGVQFCSLQITDDGLIRFANALPDANISYSMATSYITD